MDSEKIDSVVEVAGEIAGKSDDIEHVLVLYVLKGEIKPRSIDNNVEVGVALLMMTAFEHYLMSLVNEPKEKD